jgi:hypothetical protein
LDRVVIEIIIIAAVVAVVSVIAVEPLTWLSWVAERLLTRAARLLPANEQDRWLAEWLAEMDALPGTGISKLVWACGVSAGVPAMSRESRSRHAAVNSKPETSKRDDSLALGGMLFVVLLFWQHTQERAREQTADGASFIIANPPWQGPHALPAHNTEPDLVIRNGSGRIATVFESKYSTRVPPKGPPRP